ncbi:MAG: PatB family C-S lyase [Clostridiales bacterium]|nr:PatB family C-S lyase [Clostridiales bacterium]
MKYDFAFFDAPVDRLGTACEKWDGLWEDEREGLLPMWVADMDFRCAQEIVDALKARAEHPVYGYTYQRDSAVDAMLAYLKRRQGLMLTRDEQATIPCVISGLKAAVLALTDPGDSVLIQPPVYGPFFSSVKINGRTLVRNPLVRDDAGRYQINFGQLEAQLKAGVELMMICSPHNPVGRVWSRRELEQTYALCRRYGTILVADEIHSGFVYEKGAFHSVLLLDEAKDASIAVLTSATKTFNIAGLRQAALLTRNQAIKTTVTAFMDRAGALGVNIFALEATEAAYRWGDLWLDGLLAYLDAARALVKRELDTRLPDAMLSPVEATYMGWIDLRAYGLTGRELREATYAEGVALSDGAAFDKELGDGFLRINFACPHSQTVKAMELLERAVKKHAR